MNDAIARILSKLREVRRRGLTCFGSSFHRFRLNRRLPEKTLQAFEEQHGVRLPDDYRLFLKEAGNGGAGPYYGLLPLEHWNAALVETDPGTVARPSPLRPGMPVDFEWEQALGCSWEELFQGTLSLVHQGCSYYALLVVAGDYRGRVVYVNLDLCGIPYFVHHEDFLSWYERWLDELLWGYDLNWFGTGLPGREADMLTVLESNDSTADLREEALQTLHRIPELSQRSFAVLQSSLRDISPEVRARSVQLLAKHDVREATGEIKFLLRDSDPRVRQAALEALTTIPQTDWEASARAALWDEDPSVVFRALCHLKEAKALRADDVAPLFRSDDPRIRRDAIWASEAVGESIELPEELFGDADPQVRSFAYTSAGQYAKPQLVPLLLTRLSQETEWDLLRPLIAALGNLGDSHAFPALAELTEHPDGFVRQDAARALGKLGDRQAIPVLKRVLKDHTKPERRDESGLMSIVSTRSVADEAKTALRHLRW